MSKNVIIRKTLKRWLIDTFANMAVLTQQCAQAFRALSGLKKVIEAIYFIGIPSNHPNMVNEHLRLPVQIIPISVLT